MKLVIHQISSLLYRIRVGGIGQFARDFEEILAARCNKRTTGSSIHRIGDPEANFRILYIHSGWAIYNVGLLWFSQLPGVSCTMIALEEFLSDPAIQAEYNVLFFGYAYIMELAEHISFTRPAYVCVHDPLELFYEVPTWKDSAPYPRVIERLKGQEKVICISREVQGHLAAAGVEAQCVPTTSLLPAVNPSHIDNTASRPLLAITVGRIYRRKRFEMFNAIERACQKRGIAIAFRPKWDRSPLPDEQYIALLDAADVYIVTSFQEGGPLPAMDAMRRGAIVLSTHVGQMPEIIEDGVSGFLCNTVEEFMQRLAALSHDPALRQRMRHQSLRRILDVRSQATIGDALMRALDLPLT